MIVQISSGMGPAECELAVGKLYAALCEEYPDIEMLSFHKSKYTKDEGYTSIMFSTEIDLSELEGSVLWICKSPYRLNHKRKNWYVDVSVIPEVENVCQDMDIRWEAFRCSGNGGQHLQKNETGVRLIHIPTGITVTSTTQRSQYQNKQEALRKLNVILIDQKHTNVAKQANNAWREHTQIVRGNPVRTYVGMEFKRK